MPGIAFSLRRRGRREELRRIPHLRNAGNATRTPFKHSRTGIWGSCASGSPWFAFAALSLAVSVALSLRAGCWNPIWRESSAYIFFLVATALVAWTSGSIPALVTLVLGFLLANWFFIQPRFSLQIGSTDAWVNALGYAFIGLTMTWFSKLQRDAQARAAREACAAEFKRQELEVEIARHEQTRAARERLAAIVESAEDAIISKSLEGKITSWNAGSGAVIWLHRHGGARLAGYHPHSAGVLPGGGDHPGTDPAWRIPQAV